MSPKFIVKIKQTLFNRYETSGNIAIPHRCVVGIENKKAIEY